MSTSSSKSVIGRRAFLSGLAGAVIIPSAGAWAKAPALITGMGDVRSIALNNKRTGESINTIYWVEGQYIPEAMDALNHILRDWRQDRATQMDPRVIDILSAARDLMDTREPFTVVSGYRTPETNRLLRKRSRGVASKSYHMQGMAVDISMQTRSVRQIAGAGQHLKQGGVGRYSRSNFVHLDSGPVRGWGR